jgi:hypothetical protein
MNLHLSNNPNTTPTVELNPGEGIIINHRGSAEYGISIVLSKDGKELVVTGPFNRYAKTYKIKAK